MQLEPRSNHLHVDVKRHRLDKKVENPDICVSSSLEVMENVTKFSEGTLVLLRTWKWREMVWNAHLQARRFTEPICRDDNASSS